MTSPCILTASATAAETVAAIHALAGEGAVIVILDAAMAPVERAMLRAAIGPLALDLAPATRLAAIDCHPGASPAAIEATLAFLGSADAVTGQIVTLGGQPRGQGPNRVRTN